MLTMHIEKVLTLFENAQMGKIEISIFIGVEMHCFGSFKERNIAHVLLQRKKESYPTSMNDCIKYVLKITRSDC